MTMATFNELQLKADSSWQIRRLFPFASLPAAVSRLPAQVFLSPQFMVFAILFTGLLVACGDKPGTPPLSGKQSSTQQPRETTLSPAVTARTPSEEVLTVTLLEKQGAVKLNSSEILALIAGHSIVLRHLGSGEYIEAIYLENGHRSITNVDSGSIEEETLYDMYEVKNDKLHTEFKGMPVATTIYRLDQRYLAAADNDNGIVNYEFRDIVKAALTIQVLKSQNAKILSDDEIKKLFIGKNMLIKDLLTGDEYFGSYSNDGTRTLQNAGTVPESGEAADVKIQDSYRIADGKLFSILDGNEIASTIYELDSHYYGAMTIDDGAVNYEFIPQDMTQ
jgi:hypothetical protein